MALEPRWFVSADEPYARQLYALCHPGEPQRPAHWFHAHPTLVIPAAAELIAMTSFTLSPTPRGYVAYGADLCVHPDYRGCGLGSRLHMERCWIAAGLGAVDFVVTTTEDNDRMIAIAEKSGLARSGQDGDKVCYVGGIR